MHEVGLGLLGRCDPSEAGLMHCEKGWDEAGWLKTSGISIPDFSTKADHDQFLCVQSVVSMALDRLPRLLHAGLGQPHWVRSHAMIELGLPDPWTASLSVAQFALHDS